MPYTSNVYNTVIDLGIRIVLNKHYLQILSLFIYLLIVYIIYNK